MSEVQGLYDFPLTGAQAREHQQAALSQSGLLEDRVYVLYRPSTVDGSLQRVGQQAVRQLAQLSANTEPASGALTIARHGAAVFVSDFGAKQARRSDAGSVRIHEFGEVTPAVDTGDRPAEWFRNFTGIDDIRLARKREDWQLGFGRNPATTKVAPLHIVTAQSLAHIASLAGRPDKTYASRFRPNIILDVDGEEPFGENQWQEIRIGSITLKLARECERCPVPGNDQTTGEKMKDLPRIYPQLPQSVGGKALFGVYMYPLIKPGWLEIMHRGDPVTIISRV